MSPGVYLIGETGHASPMSVHSFASEGELQDLLAHFPDLLSGDTEGPPKYLLVKREAGLPFKERGSDRWSMDHLFLDRDGRPTLVEVKLSSNTEIRRQVIGQMLEYAANFVRYWDPKRIREEFDRNAQYGDPEARLAEFLAGEDSEEFWAKVGEFVEAADIRLMFVADRVPDELRAMVQFLNERLQRSEVLALEVKKYRSGQFVTAVSELIGNTPVAQQTKGRPPVLDKQAFLDQVEDGSYRTALSRFLTDCDQLGLHFGWGTAGTSIRIDAPEVGRLATIGWVYPPGVPGVAGLRDVTLGHWRTDVEKYTPGLVPALTHYVDDIGAIPGIEAPATATVAGYRLPPRVLEQNLDTIRAALKRLAEAVTGR